MYLINLFLSYEGIVESISMLWNVILEFCLIVQCSSTKDLVISTSCAWQWEACNDLNMKGNGHSTFEDVDY